MDWHDRYFRNHFHGRQPSRQTVHAIPVLLHAGGDFFIFAGCKDTDVIIEDTKYCISRMR